MLKLFIALFIGHLSSFYFINLSDFHTIISISLLGIIGYLHYIETEKSPTILKQIEEHKQFQDEELKKLVNSFYTELDKRDKIISELTTKIAKYDLSKSAVTKNFRF